MTDEEFMIGVRERLLNDKQILIATCNGFANINIEDLDDEMCKDHRNCEYQEYFDIINKAKDGNNE